MQTVQIGKGSFVVFDPEMAATLRLARRAANLNLPVLISGESGTGKEFIARYIHENSTRSERPYVTVNCAAIPDGLIEAELFGYERGAFTGAVSAREGKFERASEGTLLLDEISEMPIHLQAKLLRVLQEGEVDRLGGKGVIPVRTRVIATTNRDPDRLVDDGALRGDLYYRINVISIHCAPLRGRKVLPLALHFTREAGDLLGEDGLEIDPKTIELLEQYDWPGNIRELRNTIQRAALEVGDGVIRPDNIRFAARPGVRSRTTGALAAVEKQHILKTLEQCDGNRTAASKELGITAKTLRSKLKEYQGE